MRRGAADFEAAGAGLEGAEAALSAEECAAGSGVAASEAGVPVLASGGGLAGAGFRGRVSRRDFVGPRFARFGRRGFGCGFAPFFVGAGLYPWAYDYGCWAYTPWGSRYVCGGWGGQGGGGGKSVYS